MKKNDSILFKYHFIYINILKQIIVHIFNSIQSQIFPDRNYHGKVLRGRKVCIEFYGKIISTLIPKVTRL